jgi:hypothetical protein
MDVKKMTNGIIQIIISYCAAFSNEVDEEPDCPDLRIGASRLYSAAWYT